MGENGGTSANASEQFTEVFRTYYPHVITYVRRRVPVDRAPDIVENAFLAAWRHIGELPADPLPWLYRAASFEIRNWRRSEGRVRRDLYLATSLLDQGYLVADTADEVAYADRWTTAFAVLDEGDREVLRLVAWEDLSSEDAAAVLGCSITAFKVRLHRARRRLVRLAEADEPPASDILRPRSSRGTHQPQTDGEVLATSSSNEALQKPLIIQIGKEALS
jgi:RNA polymerase sigma-70 factor (ECF subfamily)